MSKTFDNKRRHLDGGIKTCNSFADYFSKNKPSNKINW